MAKISGALIKQRIAIDSIDSDHVYTQPFFIRINMLYDYFNIESSLRFILSRVTVASITYCHQAWT